jgi:hypothetical protein
MDLKPVSDAVALLNVPGCQYWRDDCWGLFLGPQFSEEMEGQLVLAVLEHDKKHTAFPYFRMKNGAKNLSEALVTYFIAGLADIPDVPESRPMIEDRLREWADLLGETHDDTYKGVGDNARYCQVNTTKVSETMGPIADAKRQQQAAT